MLACPEPPTASTKQQLLLSLSKDLALSYTEVLWKCGRDELWIWLTHNFQLIEQHYCCPLLLLLLWAEKKGTTDHHPVVKHSVYLFLFHFLCLIWNSHHTGFLAPVNFSGAFFTHSHFQRIVQISSLGSLHKLRLHYLAFDHVRTPLVCTFYVVNLAFFWPPTHP